jgi:type IV pilus assembly protein PilB
MGVENYLLASCLIGVLAQRLVRIICQHCRFEYAGDLDYLRNIGFPVDGMDAARLYRGQGCEACGYTGFESRKGIFELMIPDDEIRRMIVSNESSNIIAHYARSRGMKTLREDAFDKVFNGVTTLDEALRVTQEM